MVMAYHELIAKGNAIAPIVATLVIVYALELNVMARFTGD
jgi:hypothetical protein